jgi:cobalt-zinc-cadmium efflux system protein
LTVEDAHGGHHHHHHHHPGGAGAFLGAAFWVSGAILAAEVAGALAAHSLALLSDAAHMLTDVLALGASWYAARLAERPATPRRTYGYYRAGILTATANAAVLVVVAAAILLEAAARLRHPVAVTPWIMWLVAAVGLGGNLWLALRLEHGHADLNVRAAWLHVVGDAAASAAVLAAGALVALTGRSFWDPLLSAGIALLIARGAWRLIGDTVNVLMEGTPPGIDPHEVARVMTADPAVVSCHHLHVWSLDGHRTALSGHLVLREGPLSQAQAVLARVGASLQRQFGIAHATLQLESDCGGPCPDPDCGP